MSEINKNQIGMNSGNLTIEFPKSNEVVLLNHMLKTGNQSWPTKDYIHYKALDEALNPLSEKIVEARKVHESEVAALELDLIHAIQGARRDPQNHIALNAVVKAQAEIRMRKELLRLVERVKPEGAAKLFDSIQFREIFKEGPTKAFILSIDIRRSTELMLKAREPKLFAEFITVLTDRLRVEIVGNFGIFDKFTGDGILAFFPETYSGVDFGANALTAAFECHKIFDRDYRAARNYFTSIMLDTGLGIGLDYGTVNMSRVGDDLTVVGTPVVYACRMAGGAAGSTYLNQPAFEMLKSKYATHCNFEEKIIELKHDGKTLAYRVTSKGSKMPQSLPPWLSEH